MRNIWDFCRSYAIPSKRTLGIDKNALSDVGEFKARLSLTSEEKKESVADALGESAELGRSDLQYLIYPIREMGSALRFDRQSKHFLEPVDAEKRKKVSLLRSGLTTKADSGLVVSDFGKQAWNYIHHGEDWKDGKYFENTTDRDIVMIGEDRITTCLGCFFFVRHSRAPVSDRFRRSRAVG